jgi:hypothetical protein
MYIDSRISCTEGELTPARVETVIRQLPEPDCLALVSLNSLPIQ